MIIINDDRRSGKTKFCIQQAKLKNAYIITGSRYSASYVRATADFLKTTVDVFDVDTYLRNRNKMISNKPIIIDELSIVLERIFEHNKVIIATSSKPHVRICKINDMKYSLNDLRKKYGLEPIDDDLMNLKYIENIESIMSDIENTNHIK
ncbi:hypothetical protein [Thomasclavelia cocleata]|uniref:hypothetical protein n=1 Tax=Thomasclavelia cocleata TaxID=69824 RepID=UPI002432D2FB|nr:hypothetical protein [Thomasclavelia cocleata]